MPRPYVIGDDTVERQIDVSYAASCNPCRPYVYLYAQSSEERSSRFDLDEDEALDLAYALIRAAIQVRDKKKELAELELARQQDNIERMG